MKTTGSIFGMASLLTMSACDYELVPIERNVPSEACQGEDIGPASSMSVRNFGEKEILQTVSVAWFLSSDTTLSPDDRLLLGGRDQIPGIGAESTVPLSINNNIIPSDVPVGSYHLFTIVDEFDVVDEEDEENNIVHSPIEISACIGCNGSVPVDGADERVKAIAAGPGGAVYVAGTRALPNQFANDNVDGFVRRLSSTGGATLWDMAVDNCYWDSVEDIAVAGNGDVVIVGSTRPGPFASTATNFMIRRYSSTGTLLWQVSPNTSPSETGLGIVIDPSDDAVVITGAQSDSSVSALVARVSSSGTLEFVSNVSSVPGSIGRAIDIDASGRIAIVGDALSSGGVSPRRGWVSSLNATGSVLWSAVQETSMAVSSDGVGVAFDTTGNVFALTHSLEHPSPGTNHVVPLLAQYNASGVQQWSQSITFGRQHNRAADLLRESTGNLLIAVTEATFTGYRPWLARYSSSGTQLLTRSLSDDVSLVAGLAINSPGTHALVAAQSTASTNQTMVIRETL